MTIQRYVQHVLGCIYAFFTLFGYWVRVGVSPKGLVHHLLMQFFTLGSSKLVVSETYFFSIVTTQNDHPRYGNHGLGLICVFFTLIGDWVHGGGGGGGIGTQPAYAAFHPGKLKNGSFRNLFF